MPIINIQSPTAGLSVSPLGNPWIEVGTQGALSVSGLNPNNDSSSSFIFTSSNPNVASIMFPADGQSIKGLGFGVTTIAAFNIAGSPVATLTLYVGSVLIAGADGNSWRVFPDAFCMRLQPHDIAQRMQGLEKQGVLFADVGNENTYDATSPNKTRLSPAVSTTITQAVSATAVTCYLLNLATVTRNQETKD